MKYKVKNFISRYNSILQGKIKDWVESREHITIVSTNVWTDEIQTYVTIIYTENNYVL